MGIIEEYRKLDRKLTHEFLNDMFDEKTLYSFPSVIERWSGSRVIKFPPHSLNYMPFDVGDPVTLLIAGSPCNYKKIFGEGTKINEIKII